MPDPLLLRLNDPGDLVASVPVLLGFHPVASLVLVALGGRSGRRVGLTVRSDLPPPDTVGAAAGVAEAAVEALLTDTPTEAAVIVVGPPGRPEDRELVDRVVTALSARAVATRTVLWATATTGGASWGCYGACGCAGSVPDPRSSAAMAAAVVEGRIVAARREDLAERLAPTDPAALARRDRLLAGHGGRRAHTERPGTAGPGTAAHRASERGPGQDAGARGRRGARDRRGGMGSAGPGRRSDGDAGAARRAAATVPVVEPVSPLGRVDDEGRSVLGARLARLDEAVRSAAAGILTLGDEQVVDLAVTLGLPEGREAAARHSLDSAAAEELWAALARGTPDPEAAEPAALLALCALLRGNGAQAGVALDRAEAAWPGHRFTRLLRDAHDSRMRPGELRAAIAPTVRSGRAPA